MESKNLIGMVMTLVVGIICVGALLVPVLTAATATEETLQNDGYFRMNKITADSEETYTIDFVKATNTLTLNGEVFDTSELSSGVSYSIVALDNGLCRFQNGLRIQSWLEGVDGSTGYASVRSTIELSNGTITHTYYSVDVDTITATKTSTYTTAYVIDPTGDYVMKYSDSPAKVFDDTEVYAIGITNLNNSEDSTVLSVLKMTGDASEVTFSAIVGGTTATFDDIVIDKTADNDYVGVYDLNKVTATATYDNTETAITYSYFIVPYEITAELSDHLSTGEIAIIMAIPIVVIMAIVMIPAAFIQRD